MNIESLKPHNFPEMSYSHAVKAGEFVFVSGQIGMDYQSGIMKDDFETQARQAFKNLSFILDAANSGLTKVIKTTIWLKNTDNFESLNKIFKEYFPENAPARSTPVVDLPIERIQLSIEAIAVIIR